MRARRPLMAFGALADVSWSLGEFGDTLSRMSNEVVIRRAKPADLEQASRLAGCLARMHHETDPERFFLPDRVEEGDRKSVV